MANNNFVILSNTGLIGTGKIFYVKKGTYSSTPGQPKDIIEGLSGESFIGLGEPKWECSFTGIVGIQTTASYATMSDIEEFSSTTDSTKIDLKFQDGYGTVRDVHWVGKPPKVKRITAGIYEFTVELKEI